MTTTGIIEAVTYATVNGKRVPQYYVRLPLFNSIKGYSKVPTTSLPKGIYALPPHMEAPLKKGDVVYCSLLDLKSEYVIIHGLIPSMSTSTGYNGARETQSKMELSKVQLLSCEKDGTVELPYNTKIATSINTNFSASNSSKSRDYVNGKELSTLLNCKSNIQQQFDDLKKELDYCIKVKKGPVVKINKGFITSLKVDDKVWDNSASLRDSGIIKVEVDPIGQDITVNGKATTRAKLKSDYGITFGFAVGVIKCAFEVSYKLKPASIEQGGTGAADTTTAFSNLGITEIQNYLLMLAANGNIPEMGILQEALGLTLYPDASGAEGTAVYTTSTGIKLTGVVMGHACSSENRSNYGSAGDQRQTTTPPTPDFSGEVMFQSWQDCENWNIQHGTCWNYIFRPNNKTKAKEIAEYMKQAVNNKNIGYSQGDRTSLFALMNNPGATFANVGPCNCDCSSLVATVLWKAGYATGHPGSWYTACMQGLLTGLNQFGGFTCLASSDYTRRGDKLKVGDVMLRLSHGHTSIIVSEIGGEQV